jgi:histidinol-phosphate/aromatic aminotransferase/cobyric acid decarboxylase-like protein
MAFPDVPWARGGRLDGLRITVGTDEEIDTFLTALRELV